MTQPNAMTNDRGDLFYPDDEKPVASRIASALTIGYLWPALESLGVDDVTRYTYRFDTAEYYLEPGER